MHETRQVRTQLSKDRTHCDSIVVWAGSKHCMLLRHKVLYTPRLVRMCCINLGLDIPQDLMIRVGTRHKVENFLHGGNLCARVRQLQGCENLGLSNGDRTSTEPGVHTIVVLTLGATINCPDLRKGEVGDEFADVGKVWIVRDL